MAIQLMIVGHGGYGSGIESTIALIAGPCEGVNFVDYPSGEDSVILKEKMEMILNAHAGDDCLFICDLLGGTPFKMAVELSLGHLGREVVAGCNVGAILEAILLKEQQDVQMLAQGLVETTRKSVVRFELQQPIDRAKIENSGI